jgi:hypothetical protein
VNRVGSWHPELRQWICGCDQMVHLILDMQSRRWFGPQGTTPELLAEIKKASATRRL